MPVATAHSVAIATPVQYGFSAHPERFPFVNAGLVKVRIQLTRSK